MEIDSNVLDDALASANDMIDRSQSENITKKLYCGSCIRFFNWAKKVRRIAISRIHEWPKHGRYFSKGWVVTWECAESVHWSLLRVFKFIES